MSRLPLALWVVGLSSACGRPVITDVRVRQESYVATVILDVEDPDSDLDGGFVDLGWDGVNDRRPIGGPAELVGSTVQVERIYSPCHVGQTIPLEITITDGAGHESPLYRAAFDLEGGDVHQEREPDDTLGEGRANNALYVTSGDAICGSLASTGLDGEYYDGDIDYYGITFEEPFESMRITLRAVHPNAVFDLWEVDSPPGTSHYASSEVVAFDRLSSQPFVLGVMAALGPSGDYGITFE